MNNLKHGESSNDHSSKLSSFMYLFLMAFAFITLLAACSLSKNEHSHVHTVGTEVWETTSTEEELPQFLDNHTELTHSLYSQVIAHEHTLGELPCYCGCMDGTELDEPHDSLRRCYLVEYPNDDGSVRWTDHSTTCGICKQELETVIRMTEEGSSLNEIKQAIDKQFKH